MFCDRLAGQNNAVFRESIAKLNEIVWYDLTNATDLWQPVDAGYDEKLKTMVKHSFFDWLDDDNNSDRWYGVKKFTVSKRCILLSHLIGNACRKFVESKCDSFRYRLFQKPGCLITANGSDDSLIQPESLGNYEVPPSIALDAAIIALITMEVEQSAEVVGLRAGT